MAKQPMPVVPTDMCRKLSGDAKRKGGQHTVPEPGEKRPKAPPAPPMKGDPQAPFEVIDAAVLMKAINRAVNAVPGIKRIPNKDYLDLYIEALDELRYELELHQDELG